MKIFLQIIISAGLMLWLSAVSLNMAGQFYIKDMIRLHGAALTGADVQLKDVSLDLAERTLSLYNLCLSDIAPDKKEAHLLCVGVTSIHFSSDFSPGLKWKGFFPNLWALDSVEVKDVLVSYQIDSEGDNLESFGRRLLRDSLNAKAKDTKDQLLLLIKELNVSGIKVDARSKKSPDRSKSFGVRDIVFTDVGVQEGGIAPVETLNRITRAIVDGVMLEADKQGLIEKQAPSVGSMPTRKHAAAKEDGKGEENSAGKDLRELGKGIKGTSQKIWKNTKDFFN